jgi:hypothetical protein
VKPEYQSIADVVKCDQSEAGHVASVSRLSAPKPISFRDLVQREYLSKGFCFEDVLGIVRLATRVSKGSIRAAFAGTRVQAETAERLCEWAVRTHRAALDVRVLYAAPTKKRMWRGAGARLAQAPANDNGGPATVLRSLSVAGIVEHAGVSAQRRIHVALTCDSAIELDDVERALKSALGGGHG